MNRRKSYFSLTSRFPSSFLFFVPRVFSLFSVYCLSDFLNNLPDFNIVSTLYSFVCLFCNSSVNLLGTQPGPQRWNGEGKHGESERFRRLFTSELCFLPISDLPRLLLTECMTYMLVLFRFHSILYSIFAFRDSSFHLWPISLCPIVDCCCCLACDIWRISPYSSSIPQITRFAFLFSSPYETSIILYLLWFLYSLFDVPYCWIFSPFWLFSRLLILSRCTSVFLTSDFSIFSIFLSLPHSPDFRMAFKKLIFGSKRHKKKTRKRLL